MIQTFRVSIIGTGQTFGEEDVMVERNYTCSVKCISKFADVFCMKYDEFLRKFKGNKESWKVFAENAKEKEDKLNKRYGKIVTQMSGMHKSS